MLAKKEVAAKLRRYDKMRMEILKLERELARDCADYGVSQGIWGFTRDHLRMQLAREKESK
jgi:predicted translin family RNA/ssDNA-binding protein